MHIYALNGRYWVVIEGWSLESIVNSFIIEFSIVFKASIATHGYKGTIPSYRWRFVSVRMLIQALVRCPSAFRSIISFKYSYYEFNNKWYFLFKTTTAVVVGTTNGGPIYAFKWKFSPIRFQSRNQHNNLSIGWKEVKLIRFHLQPWLK